MAAPHLPYLYHPPEPDQLTVRELVVGGVVEGGQGAPGGGTGEQGGELRGNLILPPTRPTTLRIYK